VAPLGAKLKFQLGDLVLFIDGTGDKNKVSQSDEEADCTISTDTETFLKLKNGELNPMMAVMSGLVKIKGDMGLAMKLQSLIQ
jgi:putative sterol carrier protein